MMERPPQDPPDASFTSLYSLPARLASPLRRPPTSVPNSLHVVESYFGAELSDKMVDVAARLSRRQMNELETNIDSEQYKTQQSLSLVDRPRQNPEFKKHPWWKRDDRPPIIRSTEEFFQKINDRFAWTKRPHIAGATEIGVHEDALPTEVNDIGQLPILKHLALYSEHAAIRDPLERLRSGMYDQGLLLPPPSLDARRRQLANGLRQLLPIAPLIRDGTFILVGGGTNPTSVFTLSHAKPDPFLSWILGRHRPDIQEELVHLIRVCDSPPPPGQIYKGNVSERLNALDAYAQAVVRQHYPYDDVSDQAWEQLLAMVRWTSRYSLAPITTNPVIARHMVQGARIALEELSGTGGYLPAQSAAVSYRVPSLEGCQFSDIMRLRKSSLFNGVRSALLQVAVACAQSNPESYDAYQRTVSEHAQDIVGPLYRKLEARRKRNRLASLGINATSQVADLQINGIAGKLAGAAIDRLGGAVPRRRQKDAEIACGILRSVLLYK